MTGIRAETPNARGIGPKSDTFDAVVGESQQIRDAIGLAKRFAGSTQHVILITGEAGTGKELFARCIHNASSSADGPFIPISCAGLPEELLEVELFGQEGAGTEAGRAKPGIFEMVGTGTVFLEEVNELSPRLQSELLWTLETGAVRRRGSAVQTSLHCRIIASSKVSLEERVAAGAFSEPLLARLSVLRLDLAALRDRGDDVLLMAEHLFAVIARLRGERQKHLSVDAREVLRGHRWPGNARELRQAIDRAVVLCDEGLVSARHILIQQRQSFAGARDKVGDIRIPLAGRRLDDIEREVLEVTIRLTNFNQSAAARILGISRPTIVRKLRAYGLVPE